MKTLLENLNEFLRLLRTMQLADMVDIALVTFLVYQGIQLIRSSSTARIAKAVVLLLLLSWVTDLLEIHVLNFLLDRVLELGLIALAFRIILCIKNCKMQGIQEILKMML